MNTEYYIPKIEDFHDGFRHELLVDDNYEEAVFCKGYGGVDCALDIIDYYLEQGEVRVKYLDQQDIEELGWTYTGKTTELWFGIPKTYVQPFNITYRSFRLSYNIIDRRCRIIGFEWEDYKSLGEIEEDLFIGKVNNYNELFKIMEQVMPNYETK